MKLESVYDLTSTFLGPGLGEEQEGKFLGRSICWRLDVDRRHQIGKRGDWTSGICASRKKLTRQA